MVKFMMFFSWLTSVAVAWTLSKTYYLPDMSVSKEMFLIIAVMVAVIGWPVYWIFSFSEKFDRRGKKNNPPPPPPTVEPITPAQTAQYENQLRHLSPLTKQKAKEDAEQIFVKVEKVIMNANTQEALLDMKERVFVKIWQRWNNELLAIEQLQDDMLVMVKNSENLSDAEKLVLYHNIKTFITQKKQDVAAQKT